MFHGLDNRYLYSAYRITTEFTSEFNEPTAGHGTGFWVMNNHSQLALVTNRHVVDPEYADLKNRGYQLKRLVVSGKYNVTPSELPDINVIFEVVVPNVHYSEVYQNDIACIVDPQVKVDIGSPTAKIDFFIPINLLATAKDYGSQFSVCDFVAFPGFPEWYDKLQQRPILRSGTIASDPRYDYSDVPEYKGECVAYEAFSYGGSSGSPVFAVQKGPKPGPGISFPGFRELKLLGINAGHLNVGSSNQQHSGISYLYKSSAILDILEATSGSRSE